MQEYDSLTDFLEAARPLRTFAMSTRGSMTLAHATFSPDDAFLFGPETRGLPESILNSFPAERLLRLPMRPHSRSMNLSNSVAVTVFEAWRQNGFKGGI